MAEFSFSELLQQSKGQLDLVPDGDYNVKIIAADATKASTGALMFKVKVEITDGPNIKRRIPTNLVVSTDNPMALAIFFRNMENVGLDANFFAQNPTPEQVASAMLNRPARVKVGHKAWQGVDRNEVQGWLTQLGGASGLPGAAGPVAPGTVIGAPGPVLPTSATPTSTATPVAGLPTAKPTPLTPEPDINPATIGGVTGAVAGPNAPDSPPALPI